MQLPALSVRALAALAVRLVVPVRERDGPELELERAERGRQHPVPRADQSDGPLARRYQDAARAARRSRPRRAGTHHPPLPLLHRLTVFSPPIRLLYPFYLLPVYTGPLFDIFSGVALA